MGINIKTLDYKVKELKAGELLGIEEFLLQDVSRCVQATAITECEIQYIDIQDFLESKSFYFNSFSFLKRRRRDNS